MGVGVFAMDFAGAGQSEGKFLSLGFHEKDDLATAVEYLVACPKVTRIGVWGHSMGACTCLMYAGNGGGEHVSGMVLDSSFSTLDVAISETAAMAKQRLGEDGGAGAGVAYVPDMLIPLAIGGIRRSIITQAQFDIRDVRGALLLPTSPLSHCTLPLSLPPSHCTLAPSLPPRQDKPPITT